jgi:probable HAF family extracellular repeat protein
MEPLEERRLLSYTVTNLGSLGGTASVPVEVNNHGEVVGYSYTANETANAFVYKHGRMTDLGTLGGAISGAMGINDRGTVVGLSNIAPGSTQVDAFLEQGGKLKDLGPIKPALVADDKISINGDGDISGLSAGGYDALIHRRGINIDLGSLGGMGSTATDLNDREQAVGFSVTAVFPAANTASQPTVDYHAFRYTDGKMTDLGTLGGTDSAANAINDHGVVVGYSNVASNAAMHAFLFSQGKMTDLGTLGGRNSEAAAINDQGAVVGASLTSSSVGHGFVDLHGRMIDLNSLIPAASGLVITNAMDINNRGQIVAQGYETSQPTTDLALLLNPTRSAR